MLETLIANFETLTPPTVTETQSFVTNIEPIVQVWTCARCNSSDSWQAKGDSKKRCNICEPPISQALVDRSFEKSELPPTTFMLDKPVCECGSYQIVETWGDDRRAFCAKCEASLPLNFFG